MSAINTTISHTGIYAIGNVIRYMTSFVMLPIYTRYLTPADYGVLELLSTIVDFVGILLGMRIGEAVFRYYVEQESSKQKNTVIMTAMVLVALTFGFGVLVMVVLALPISGLVFGSADYMHYVQLFAVIMLLQALAEVPLILMRAQQRPWLFVSFSTLKLLLQVGFNIYFVVLLDLKVEGVIYSGLISSAIFAILLLVYVISTIGLVRPDYSLGRKMIGFSLPLMLSGLGAFYLTFGDRYFLRVYSDLSEIGIYALGYKFGFLLGYMIWVPFSNVWDTQKYHIHKQTDGKLVFQRTFLLLSFVTILLGLGMSLFVEDVLRVMSAPEFWPASHIVPVIVVAYIVQMWTFYCSLGIYLRGNTMQMAYSTAIASVAITVTYFLLIPPFGGMGAAVATLLAFLVRLIWVDWAARKHYDMELPWGRVLSILGVATAVYMAGSIWVPEHWLAALLWKSALCMAYIGLFLVMPIFTERQKKALLAFIKNPKKVGEIIG